MNLVDFSLQEGDSGFLDVPNTSPRSLHDLFTSDAMPTGNWDLTNRDIEEASDTPSQEKVVVASTPYFKKIKPGNQDNQIGSVNISLAKDLCEALNDFAPVSSVAFSEDRLVNHLTGGTCSAMSFQFTDDYLRKKSTTSIQLTDDGLVRVTTPTPKEIIDEISHKYESSSEEFRTTQAVFNTLHRDANYPSGDFTKAKVASMLRFYDRHVTDASEMFYLEAGLEKEAAVAMEKIASFLNQFQEGVFAIRCILLDPTSDKGEEYGHSTILIREPEEEFFYDCNQGVLELSKDYGAESLFHVLKPVMQKWVVPFGRIYKVQ